MAQRVPPMSDEKVTKQICPEIVVLNKINIKKCVISKNMVYVLFHIAYFLHPK